MKAHVVLAHPEPLSFNGHLASLARRTFEERGWSVTVSDLYAMGFDPSERAAFYRNLQNSERFDTQSEQRHAAMNGTIPAEVQAEIGRLDQADLVILQYPMWWHMPPAILKGWFDRVFVYGEVYKSDVRFDKGRFQGKKAMLSLTVATSAETYAFNGRSGDIDLMLWPVNFTLAYVGFGVLQPFVAYGVESGLRYSSSGEIEERLQQIQANYVDRLQTIEEEATIPFNCLDEWGADGRIKASAPAHSPFIRHREHLEID
ncbi:NAD(P)H-dependent oxidoreductase [Denitrobaculum tricleocarpae]|uniref:NAD(P)H-dependent oxidoreductase n=1 Tax=Denitrobaculum tricleocarpae TaxID=2591009 RepID=A0A545ST99_9PROT|nr:NAD(P)H-dependent oxidoreductase [Denitrobaculum tricleocarpae]TQV68207.1 NAD(P)H-dependent oxidoreductase [Denitrobaculum tricleocarpae]